MNREVICFDAVAPVRERGLKLLLIQQVELLISRSREGARIEIKEPDAVIQYATVAPVRERGLKFMSLKPLSFDKSVAPVRERGLK